eukprot:6654583-Prymnesium_polylepis.1
MARSPSPHSRHGRRMQPSRNIQAEKLNTKPFLVVEPSSKSALQDEHGADRVGPRNHDNRWYICREVQVTYPDEYQEYEHRYGKEHKEQENAIPRCTKAEQSTQLLGRLASLEEHRRQEE